MKKNMGNADRIIRTVIVLIFATLYYTGTVTGLIGIALIILSVVFLATSLLSFCPIYAIFGMNSCPAKKST
ncbi:MAG: DUF2892 domain-containing protein [Cyclobacteriaceae bacterium]